MSVQETHSHCQSEVSRDSVLHYWEDLNQVLLEGAEKQVVVVSLVSWLVGFGFFGLKFANSSQISVY